MRKWMVAFVAFGLVLFGGLFALVVPWPCPVNRVAFERVKEGMTPEEVHVILGGPPGDYRTRPVTRPLTYLNVSFRHGPRVEDQPVVFSTREGGPAEEW